MVILMSRLRELRKERGFTQVKMQMLTGIDQSAYSKIERGERYLSFEQCRRVALALNTSMDYLAGLTDATSCKRRNRHGANHSNCQQCSHEFLHCFFHGKSPFLFCPLPPPAFCTGGG